MQCSFYCYIIVLRDMAKQQEKKKEKSHVENKICKEVMKFQLIKIKFTNS